ncbi:MAG TPA: hypothetical protein VMF32_05340 [Xanthobacteraceae bacterium]|nr:hypothetical protein [Xanthobacteraceae bacterium]
MPCFGPDEKGVTGSVAILPKGNFAYCRYAYFGGGSVLTRAAAKSSYCVNSLNFRMISEKISRYSAFEEDMTWTTPDLIEISIGLGIDGYFRPSSDL